MDLMARPTLALDPPLLLPHSFDLVLLEHAFLVALAGTLLTQLENRLCQISQTRSQLIGRDRYSVHCKLGTLELDRLVCVRFKRL
jgi:hypothetical protein